MDTGIWALEHREWGMRTLCEAWVYREWDMETGSGTWRYREWDMGIKGVGHGDTGSRASRH